MAKTELEAIASDVVRLSTLLTRDRDILPITYLEDRALRRAYITYFLPANMYKVHIPFKELSLHPAGIFVKERLKILDLGSGPGTALIGILYFFAAQKECPYIEFTAVDPVVENLEEAEGLFKQTKEKTSVPASLLTIKGSIERIKSLPKGPFDVIVLSNVLGEIAHSHPDRIERRSRLLDRLLTGSLAGDGSCIIIEPALKETSRELLTVRDAMVDKGFHVYSPCLMDDPCPALTNPKDWCHEDIPWEPPYIIKEIDRLTGMRKDSLKFSYITLRKDQLSLRDICIDHPFRVVSNPLISKGKMEFYICGPGGRRLAVRLDKDETPSNKPFTDIRRGEIVSIHNMIDDGKRLKIGKETIIDKIISIKI